ncbi:DUF2357 domain-containing protein [Lacihabitans sp. LS3-19]|uniref:DUF2357 domain-containing protein n=1 Tax=Lacihabitans sp. LS3-19 TaxID=2487335 RepID=UPI0020CDE33A|nr:DUF2357 domain-containing protein [Lacihabitans sp. LS3-19]
MFDFNNAEEEGECRYQLKEGYFYDYEFSKPNYVFKNTDYIQPHSRNKHIGVISPNIYVGALSFEIFHADKPEQFYKIKLEVQSVKSDYRTDYRYMLESITEKCTDLIMQIDSPISQHFETNFDTDSQTLYQRFSFVKSLIDSLEFEEAIQKIFSNPTTKWEEEHEEKDIRSIRRFNQKNIKQLVTKSNRIELNCDHFLNKSYGLSSIPTKIDSTRKAESIDTAENRFIKHALEEFLFFCENCELKFEKYSTAKFESGLLATKISTLLNQSFFKQISRPVSLKLNSPVLQRKSGYREVLNAWLKFDLAAKLIWHGGDKVYDAGKKDIATLYEYWLFFTLLDLLKEVFEIEPKSIAELIQYDKGQLSLNLKQGKAIAMKGVYKSPSRNLNIQFSYNRSFGGGKTFPNSGSYTTTLRPDYTLSIWPEEIKEPKDAERTELITHIHFDAKYKVNNFYELVSKSKNEELSEEENNKLIEEELDESKKGTFKNQDLLKMHAYKDAIRRTGGAYVLYPGKGQNEPFRGFHELIPGLGAFVIKPNEDDKDKEHLKNFIKKVIANFIDRASQREHTAVKIYDIHKDEKDDTNVLNEPMPEYLDIAKKEKLIPDETYILVGYCKNKQNIEDFYKKHGLYNFRMDDDKGSLSLENEVVNAKYLLLRESGKETAKKIFKIKSKGPKVYKGTSLVGYKTSHLKDYYLVIEIEKEESSDFNGASFNFKDLEKYKEIKSNNNPRKAAGIPFAVSLKELMKEKTK